MLNIAHALAPQRVVEASDVIRQIAVAEFYASGRLNSLLEPLQCDTVRLI